MNRRVRNFRSVPCCVCGYKFADQHHIYPKSLGGIDTVALCPNHHRYANMLQVVLRDTSEGVEDRANAFAEMHFDKEFNEKILERLISMYVSIDKEVAIETRRFTLPPFPKRGAQ